LSHIAFHRHNVYFLVVRTIHSKHIELARIVVAALSRMTAESLPRKKYAPVAQPSGLHLNLEQAKSRIDYEIIRSAAAEWQRDDKSRLHECGKHSRFADVAL
jgi:hypothetical protein